MKLAFYLLSLATVSVIAAMPAALASSKREISLEGKRQWGTTCSYWRWSKCRGRVGFLPLAPQTSVGNREFVNAMNMREAKLIAEMRPLEYKRHVLGRERVAATTTENMMQQSAEYKQAENSIRQKKKANKRALLLAALRILNGRRMR